MFKRLSRNVAKFNNIDKTYETLSKTSDVVKIQTLITRLQEQPEIKVILTKFLKDLNAIGINQDVSQRFDNRYKYYTRMLKFRQLHHVFWELCKVNDISQHDHKLRINYENIGLLDPKNFPPEEYKKIIEE
ncbi:hypothetical protein CLIB1444_07S02432 [[Candida] jaroonii]|uniref:Uncharacterized protein n=1 Tax=[Candida] jaroonii TaxID=467808 RepID=A0ACA9Y9S2_9ASCO|nr:hypothetical protein CLIB1444_07S02432 [[Candida] jaroonii]